MPQSTRTFRLFVSSTFSDLKAERNALQEFVFPRLRDLSLAHGWRFQPIDLRWGVSEEAALDQQTMKICLGEIERCQKMTPRPNFLILLGDRFGWRPLPYTIPAEEFQKLLPFVSEDILAKLVWRNDLQERENGWYRRDDNAVPPAFILQPRQIGSFYEDYSAWEDDVERPLVAALEKAALQAGLDDTALEKYTLSATGQEIARGALKVANASEHVFGYFREIEALPRSSGIYGEVDVENDKRQKELKQQLIHNLPGNIREYSVRWQGDSPSLDYLDQLCKDVYADLSKVILSEIDQLEAIHPIEREIVTHYEFGENRARIFVGQTKILSEIAHYLKGNNSHPLVVWGPSGSGKSALMAKVVQQCRENGQDVLFRFIGATPESSNGRSLLDSLCRQLTPHYGEDERDFPSSYKELVLEFPKRLATAASVKPVVLFLDALDQLSDVDNSRNLTWLPSELPPNVHLIVSTLPGECLKVLENRVPVKNRLEIQPITVNEGKIILDLWLIQAGRKLQPEQERYLLAQFRKSGLPLYLKVAFEEARLWKSFDPLPEWIADVPGILRALFSRLSLASNHGQMMVSRSLGYLGAAKNGLSEDELVDLLSIDEEFIADFRRRHPKSPVLERLPVVVWSRLFFDLEPYLTERNADGRSLLTFYHRQILDASMVAYRDTNLHTRLAKYFYSQPLYLKENKQVPNLRKLSEMIYQQIWAGQVTQVEETLLDYSYLEAKLAGQGVNELIEDYALVPKAGMDKRKEKILSLVQGALQLSQYILTSNPDILPGQLTGRLYGSPEPEINHLLDVVRNHAAKPWICPISYALNTTGGPLEQILLGHTGNVSDVAITPDGRRIVSCGSAGEMGRPDGTVRIWDLGNGLLEHTLNGHTGSVNSLAITPDGCQIVSGGDDRTIRIWNIASGRLEHVLKGHKDSVRSVAITPDGRRIVSGSEDCTVRVWNLVHTRLERTLKGHTRGVADVKITPDGCWIVSAGAPDVMIGGDDTIRVWNLAHGRLERVIDGGNSPLAITLDGSWIVSGSKDYNDYPVRMLVWDLKSGYLERELEVQSSAVCALAVTPDCCKIISGTGDGNLRVWDIASGQHERTLKGASGGVTSIAITPDGRRIASGGGDNTVRVWDLESTRLVPELEGHTGFGGVSAVAVTPDGKQIVSGAGRWGDHTVCIWDLASGRLKRVLKGHTGPALTVAVSPNGRWIISGGMDLTIRIWELPSGRLHRTLEGHTGSVDMMERSGSLYTDSVNAVTVTSDSRRIISGGSDHTVRIWDLASGRLERILEGHTGSVHTVGVTLDGRRIVSGNDTLRVWDLATGQLERILTSDIDNVLTLAVTPDSRRIISGGRDHIVRVWDLESGRLELSLNGHREEVRGLAVTSDGTRLISSGGNPGGSGSLRLWNLVNGQEIASWTPDPGVEIQACCTVRTDPSLFVYGDSVGHVHVLRLIE